MTENFYTILTHTGLAKIANSQVVGSKVDLVEMAVGDGDGSYYDPTSGEPKLKREVWRGAIGSVDIDGNNANWIVIETVIPAMVGGFTVREVGLFDADGDLIAIGKYPETYKPVLAEGSAKDLYIRMIIEVSNASSVTLKVDPVVVIASKKYVDEQIKKTTKIIVTESPPLVSDREQGAFYFHVTDKAPGGSMPNEIKVSPAMGIKMKGD